MISLKKSQNKGLAFKGEITVFMALIFILMLSVVGALIESASIQITKNRKRTDTMLALESTFAEYSKDLLEEYEIFARLDLTETVLNNRLSYYGAKNMDHSIEQVQFLSDYNGTPFYQQVVRYMKDWLGMESITPDSDYDFSEDDTVEEAEQNNLDELETMLDENEVELSEEDSPLDEIAGLKSTALLSMLVPNQEELSDRSISLETLASKRQLEKGSYTQDTSNGATDKIFFVAYVMEHFSDMTNQNEENALLYELEYLLGGCASDRENLEKVCKKIVNIRTVANYTYLLTDSTKQAEADALALTVCSLVGLPELEELLKQALLFAWAYGESVMDMRVLLKGEKVPFVKTSESWQLDIDNLFSLGTENEVASEKGSEKGLSYQDYLKGFLLLEGKETLSMRCLDLIESNLDIKADECVTQINIKSKADLRRGIQETFTTKFRYQ